MPLLSTETKSNISFKKLVGKSHTGNATDFFQESISSQVSIDTSEIVGQDIPKDPAQAFAEGLVEYVKADLQQISASNGLAFNLRFPIDYDGFFGSGVAGDLIRSKTQVVDQKNNLDDGQAKSDNSGGYIYDLEDGNGNDISLGAEEGWQIDPVAGILTSEEVIDELDNTGGSVGLYVYTGDFLNAIIENLKDGVLTAPGNDNEVTFNDGGDISTNAEFTFDGTALSVPELNLSSEETSTSAGDFTMRLDSNGNIREVGGGGEARYEGGSAFTFGNRLGTVGGFSVVLNDDNRASGTAALAVGSNNEATGDSSFAAGDLSKVTAGISSVIGDNLLGRVYAGTAVGHYNEDYLGSGNEKTSINASKDSDRVFSVGVGDSPAASPGNNDYIDGRGRVDGLYVTVRKGTYVRHGLQIEGYNSSTGNYERIVRFGSSIDKAETLSGLQFLARNPNNSDIIEYSTAEDLFNEEINVNDGLNITTSFNSSTGEYTISTVQNPEFDSTLLISPDGTPYEVTVTDEGNLKTRLASGGLENRIADTERLTYDTETLEVQAAQGQTAPLFRGDDENDNSVFEVSPTGQVTIQTPGEGVVLTSPNGTQYEIRVKDDGTIQSNEI